jgi:protein ImuB
VDVAAIARDFSPRIQRYGRGCVVLDVSGLGRLLGEPAGIGRELCRAFERLEPAAASSHSASPRVVPAPRYRGIYAHPREHAAQCFDRFHPDDVGGSRRSFDEGQGRGREDREARVRDIQGAVAIAPTQTTALLMARAHEGLSVVTADPASALAAMPVQVAHQWLAEIHGVTFLRGKAVKPAAGKTGGPTTGGWPSWEACEYLFDVLERWGVRTLGELAGLPAGELPGRIGQDGLALQQLACGIDAGPLVPDPEVPRFLERIELEWPIEELEPLSFVLARLLDPLSAALERADRGAAAIRLDLRLVDRTTHQRVLQLPAAMRDARVLRTLLLLDLESHPPTAAIDVVTIEIDPAPARILQYSLLERATPSAETVATLAARLGALVGESRCGTPVLLDTHRPDGFEMKAFQGSAPAARRASEARRAELVGVGPHEHKKKQTLSAGLPTSLECGPFVLRRFRPPVPVRVAVAGGRPVRVAVDRRGMPGGDVVQAAGPWRSSGAWWDGDDVRWDRDEWDVALGDGSICRICCDRQTERWVIEGVID